MNIAPFEEMWIQLVRDMEATQREMCRTRHITREYDGEKTPRQGTGEVVYLPGGDWARNFGNPWTSGDHDFYGEDS